MVKSLNNEVLKKVDEIISYIESSDTYVRYKNIESKMKKDVDIMDKVNKVKFLQKEMVKFEIEKKDITSFENEVEEIMLSLNSYPIFQEYTYLLEDLNNTFQNIKSIIENYLNSKIN